MLGRFGAALRRKAGWFVDDQRVLVLMNDQALRKINHILGQLDALFNARWPCIGICVGVRRRNADGLARQHPVARRCALAIDADLPSARPTRYIVETCVGQYAAEPAVKPDAIIIGVDNKFTNALRARLIVRSALLRRSGC